MSKKLIKYISAVSFALCTLTYGCAAQNTSPCGTVCYEEPTHYVAGQRADEETDPTRRRVAPLRDRCDRSEDDSLQRKICDLGSYFQRIHQPISSAQYDQFDVIVTNYSIDRDGERDFLLTIRDSDQFILNIIDYSANDFGSADTVIVRTPRDAITYADDAVIQRRGTIVRGKIHPMNEVVQTNADSILENVVGNLHAVFIGQNHQAPTPDIHPAILELLGE